jgi:hypothetical protein
MWRLAVSRLKSYIVFISTGTFQTKFLDCPAKPLGGVEDFMKYNSFQLLVVGLLIMILASQLRIMGPADAPPNTIVFAAWFLLKVVGIVTLLRALIRFRHERRPVIDL